MDKKSEIGNRIRTMRKSRDMTQEDLAKAIGQSASSITMYETGRREPDLETMEALADVFNVPLASIVMDTKAILENAFEEYYEKNGYPESNVPQTSEARILAKGIDKLPKEQREQALSVVKAMFAKYADFFEKENDDET